MVSENFIQNGLFSQGLPTYSNDTPYIQDILATICIASKSLDTYPHINQIPTITIVEKELLRP